MALARAAGVCRLALRTQWAAVRLLGSTAAGEALPSGEDKQQRFDLAALRRERVLRPPAERTSFAPPRKVYDTPRPSYEQLQLNKDMVACATAEAVLDLVTPCLAVLNGVNASTALLILSRRARLSGAATWLSGDPRFTQLLHATESLFGRMEARALSNALYACGQLVMTPPFDWLERFWGASRRKLGDFNPQDLSNTLYACGQLGITPPDDWLQQYWDAGAPKLGDFTTQNLSNTLYACGKLGIMPLADWLLRYWHASALKLGEFKPQDLSNTLYACGQLDITPPADWLQRYWVDGASKLDDFIPQNLSNTLYACGQLGITPPADWLLRYWDASAWNLGGFNEQGLSNTLHACGQLGVTPPADWLERFWHASALKLGEFIPQALSNTLYACGQLGITPPADWLHRFWHACALKLPEFIPQHYSNTLYACGQLGITPPTYWLQRFFYFSAAKLGDFTPQESSNTILACGLLDTRPPAAWLQSFSETFERVLPDSTQQSLANTALALAMLALWEPPLWRGLWERLCASLSRDFAGWSADDGLAARQLYQAYQAAAVEQAGLLHMPSPELLASAQKCWVEVRDFRTSKLHADVSACLTRMGVAHANERWCERAERSIDIAIDSSVPVSLEVDGPTHFLQDGRQDGRTALRNRLLAAHGWRVVVVDYRVWNEQQTEAQRQEFLRRLLA